MADGRPTPLSQLLPADRADATVRRSDPDRRRRPLRGRGPRRRAGRPDRRSPPRWPTCWSDPTSARSPTSGFSRPDLGARRPGRTPARPDRPAGDQGRRGDVRGQHGGAGDRGAGRRRPAPRRRRSARGSRPPSAARSPTSQPGSAKATAVKEALQAEGLWSQYLEVGHRTRPGDLHQGTGAVGRRRRRPDRRAGTLGLEQPRARGGAGRRARTDEPSGRRSATTSTCATSRAAARCCSARPRTTTRPARSDR